MKIHYLFIALCLIGSSSLSAQSIYNNYGQDNVLRLELNKPIFSDDSGLGFLSIDSYLNGEFKVGKKNKIAFEVPYSRINFNSSFGDESISNLGNIAIAYQIRNLVKPNFLEFKVRLPTVDNNTLGSLLLTDYTERFTSVIRDLVSFEPSYNLESSNSTGLYYRFKPGFKLLIPTRSNTFDDSMELLLDLNILYGYRSEAIDINAGLTTTSIITEGDIDFGDRVLRQMFTSFTYTGSAFKPGLLIRIPLGDTVGSLYDFVVGLQLAYTFGNKSNKTPMDSSSEK